MLQRLGIVVLANRNYPIETRVKATYSLIEVILAARKWQIYL